LLLALGLRFGTLIYQRWAPSREIDSGSRAVSRGVIAQTCRKCWSVRFQEPHRLVVGYKSSKFDTCDHVWEDRLTAAVEEPLNDGIIVLVKNTECVGAFIPSAQTTHSMNYSWYFRCDGKGYLQHIRPRGGAWRIGIQRRTWKREAARRFRPIFDGVVRVRNRK